VRIRARAILALLVAADARIGPSHLHIADAGGLGTGGHCFIKDFEAFIGIYAKATGDLVSASARRMGKMTGARLAGEPSFLLIEIWGQKQRN